MRTLNHSIPWLSSIKMLVALVLSSAAQAEIAFGVGAAEGPRTRCAQTRDYRFDGKISREVLENYLSRSVSFTELLHDDLSQPRNRRGVDPRDNIRFILNTGAKFVGRALMCWGREGELDALLRNAKVFAAELHKADPDIVLQGAAFEIVTRAVETITIPEYVLKEFGQPVTRRNFSFSSISYPSGTHRMGNGNIPDMNQLEARMWFYYLCTQYIDAGIEAIHFGQIGLMDRNDRGHIGWIDMLDRVRAYAHQHARRHFVICDAHTPTGGYVENGKLLFDAHAFPLRIAQGNQPLKGKLQIGYTDAIFNRSKGGITPSGWSCEHLPYLVEFDNFGGRNQGRSSAGTIFCWGYDEITWFSVQPEAERNAWLWYAWRWITENDPNGHLEMPGSRVITPARGSNGPRWYWANTRNDACPNGSNTEQTIKEIWAVDSAAMWGSRSRFAPVQSPEALYSTPTMFDSGAGSAPGGKPNLVFIFSDDQGYADLGCFGSTTIKTPNVDRIAAEGMKLMDFYAAPVCSPSRSALMTGCCPQRIGMGDAGGKVVLYPGQPEGLNPDEVIIPQLLKGQGYATMCIGKWHLGDQPPYLPTHRGFDHYFGIPFSNNMGNMYGLPPLPLMRDDKVIEENPKQALLTKRYTEEAIKFIHNNKDRPFFLYLPHTMPHTPVSASEEFRGKTTRGAYGDACEELDWSTGQILDTIKQLGLDEKTLVMYVSDNGGGHLSENTPLHGSKGSAWEGGIRVCAVARWPGKIPPGTVCREITSTMDILPTFAHLAGAEVPKGRIIDGIDIWPLLAGQPGARGHDTFSYYVGSSLQAVRSGKWKLMIAEKQRRQIIRFDPPKLFDLEEDIGENNDVAAQNPDVVQRLQELIEKCREDMGDGKPGKGCRPCGYYKDAKTLTTKKPKIKQKASVEAEPQTDAKAAPEPEVRVPDPGSRSHYPDSYKPQIHYGEEDLIGVTSAGTLSCRYRGDWNDPWGKYMELYLAEARQKVAARGSTPPKKVVFAIPILKNCEVVAGNGTLGGDGKPLRGIYDTPERVEQSMREQARDFEVFFYAASDGEVVAEAIFPVIDGLKVNTGPQKTAFLIWARGLQDQLLPKLKDYENAGVIEWIFVTTADDVKIQNPAKDARGRPLKFGRGPFGLSFTAYALYGGYTMATTAASAGLWVHEFNHRLLDGLRQHAGVQLTRNHSLGHLGYAPGHSLDEVYFATYRYAIRPAMWERFSSTVPMLGRHTTFEGQAYDWKHVQEDCWFETPLLTNSSLAQLTGIPSFETVVFGGGERLFTVADADRDEVHSTYIDPPKPWRSRRGEKPPPDAPPPPPIQLDNYIRCGAESCAVLKTATGTWLFVMANMADLYADMFELSGKGDRTLPVYGYVNDGVLPLLVFKAPADMPLPSCEEGLFRAVE